MRRRALLLAQIIPNTAIAYNEIWYTTTDGSVLQSTTNSTFEDATLSSNSYTSGIGKLVYLNDVTALTNNMFRGCNTLEYITLPDGVKSLGTYAFGYCRALVSAPLPDSVTSIGNYAFYECDVLTSVTIPNSVTSIGTRVFSGCEGLTNVTIGNSVRSIGDYAFNGCTSLKELRIEDGETTLSLGYNGSSKGLFYDCPLESVYLGRNISYNTNNDYGYSPFYNKKELKSLTIGNSVTSIEKNAFRNCNGLTNVTIPSSVTSIGDNAFYQCSGLKSIEIPNSVTSIGYYAFIYCTSLREVHISGIAAWCNINFSDGTSNPLYYSGNLYLNGKLVKDLVIPESVTRIRKNAFYSFRSLTSLTIPNSVTSIEHSAFYQCIELTSVTIPNSVTSIEDNVFAYCNKLTSVTIPNITSVGQGAFHSCTALSSIYCKATTPPTIGTDTFSNVPTTCTVYVPTSAVSAYMNASGWNNFIIAGYEF